MDSVLELWWLWGIVSAVLIGYAVVVTRCRVATLQDEERRLAEYAADILDDVPEEDAAARLGASASIGLSADIVIAYWVGVMFGIVAVLGLLSVFLGLVASINFWS
jgi:hypothetical protein